MKKNIFMILNLIAGILLLVISNALYNDNKNNYGMVFMILGMLFVSLYMVILGYVLYKKLNNKNDLLIGGISIGVFALSYLVYISSFNTFFATNFILSSTLLSIFYVSFLTMILCMATIFYFWNANKKKKNILYFLVISTAIILVLLLSSKLFNSLPIFIVESIKFLYFTGIILVFLYFIVIIIYKIVKPLKK